MPFVCVLLIGAGSYVIRDQRRMILGAGLGLAAVMLATGAALTAARHSYLDGVPANVLPAYAAAALYDTLVRFLRDAIRSIVLIGLLVVVAAAALLIGPSVTATTARRWTDAGLAAAKGGLAALGLGLEPVTRWVKPRAAAPGIDTRRRLRADAAAALPDPGAGRLGGRRGAGLPGRRPVPRDGTSPPATAAGRDPARAHARLHARHRQMTPARTQPC